MKRTLPALLILPLLALSFRTHTHADTGTATPATSGPDTKATAVPSGKQINIETKFIEVSEEAWKKLPMAPLLLSGGWIGGGPSSTQNACHFDPEVFPELKNEKLSYDEMVQELTAAQKSPGKPDPGWLVLGVVSPVQLQYIAHEFISRKGWDLLSAPAFTVMTSHEGKVAITRQFRYASAYGPDKKPTEFATKDVGITMQATPTMGPDGETIELDVTVESVTLLGFLFPDANHVQRFAPGEADGQGLSSPVFSTKTTKVHEDLWDGQTLMLGAVQTEVGAAKNGAGPDTVRSVHLVAVTVHIVRGDSSNEKEEAEQNVPLSSPTPSPATPDKKPDSDIPYGVPIDGKPGFVTSPYAPDAGAVDLRGYSKGTEVKDPYTGKVFLVP